MKKDIQILKLLADETRFRIVEFLLSGEKCVCEIVPITKTKQSNVSIQLKHLEKSGILKSRKEGKKVFYKIKYMQVCDIFKALGNKKGNSLKKSCCGRK